MWIDERQRLVWARGTHEYRPMGAAVLAVTDQFRARDFRQTRAIPRELAPAFAGFFGSLETLNEFLSQGAKAKLRRTPAHLL